MAHIHHAVDDHRGRLLPARIVEVGGPGDAELPDVRRVNIFQRAEALFVVAEADRAPVVAVAAGLEQGLAGLFRLVERSAARDAVILRCVARRQCQSRAAQQRGRKDPFRHNLLSRSTPIVDVNVKSAREGAWAQAGKWGVGEGAYRHSSSRT